MTHEEEVLYAVKEAIQVMEHYNTGDDFALVSSLRRLRELEQNCIKHDVSGKPNIVCAMCSGTGIIGNGVTASNPQPCPCTKQTIFLASASGAVDTVAEAIIYRNERKSSEEQP